MSSTNENRLGTIWNSWETQWSGVVSTKTEKVRQGRNLITRSIETTRSDLSRTGIRTELVEQVEEETQGTRTISKALILWIRSKNNKLYWHRFLS